MTDIKNEPRGAAKQTASAWRAPLAGLTGGFLLFETVTGFCVWLMPFALGAQFMLLAHTVAGVAMIVPYAIYQTRHWRTVSQQGFSHHKVTGYASFAALLICIVSGGVLTWQATAATRIDYGWDVVHIGSGIATVALLAVHLGSIVVRDVRRGTATADLLRRARRVWGLRSTLIAVVLALLTLGWRAAYTHPDLSWELPSDYSMSYGDNPFAPSLANTTSGALHPRALSGSASCGQSGCHEQIYEEWLPSAHRFASTDVAFQAVQKVMAENEGPDSTRYCAGCHDPIALFSGSKNIYDEDLSSPGAEEGVSCVACHRLIQTDLEGNASYVMSQPDYYAYELDESPLGKFLSAFLIRAYPRRHVEQYSLPLLKSPEYCAACHKQFIDEEINDFGWVQLQNQFDNWRKSHWNREGEPSREAFCSDCHERKGVDVPEGASGRCTAISTSCRECHMRLVDSSDPASGDIHDLVRREHDKKHRDHRFIGANQFMPTVLGLKGHKKQVSLTEAWLRGEAVIPEIAHKWPELSKEYLQSNARVPTPHERPSGPVLPIRIRVEGGKITPGKPVKYAVDILSRKVGHDFPTGPLDVIQCWVETEVVDAKGNTLYHSGRLTETGFIEKGSVIFKAEGVDAQGNLIDRHNLWELVGARFKRSLFPGYTDTARFEFTCPDQVSKQKTIPGATNYSVPVPEDVAGPVTVRARLLYRKINQHLLNIVTGKTDVRAPVTEIDSTTTTVPVEPKR